MAATMPVLGKPTHPGLNRLRARRASSHRRTIETLVENGRPAKASIRLATFPLPPPGTTTAKKEEPNRPPLRALLPEGSCGGITVLVHPFRAEKRSAKSQQILDDPMLLVVGIRRHLSPQVRVTFHAELKDPPRSQLVRMKCSRNRRST